MNRLQVTWCYPDILNLHGDRGNIMALERVSTLLGIQCDVIKVTNFNDSIDFDQTDILFFNPGEFKSIEYIVNAMSRCKEELDRYVEGNKVLVAIGTTGAAFGRSIHRLDGPDISGLGYLDMICEERANILGDDLICKVRHSNYELNGSQIQVMDTHLQSDIALAEVSYGYGNDGYEGKSEGARYKNLYFTNLLGPVLVKNPWFTEELIKEAMRNKGVVVNQSVPEEEYELERNSLECIRQYNTIKSSKKPMG